MEKEKSEGKDSSEKARQRRAGNSQGVDSYVRPAKEKLRLALLRKHGEAKERERAARTVLDR